MNQALIHSTKCNEFYTPNFAVEPILKYLKPNSKILCPFDTKESEYVKVLTQNGHEVIFTHIDNGKDFFTYTKKEISEMNLDYIISNPPFDKKRKY